MSARKRRRTKTKKKQRQIKTLAITAAIVLIAVLTAVSTLFITVAIAAYNVPKIKPTNLLQHAQTSKIFDADGNLITNLYVEQNRINVPLERISPNIQKAVIATEDQRFYEHEGVDWKAISRALFADVESGKIVEGGSTLTQQFVKNTFITPEKTFNRKIREAALAYQIEKQYSKKEILTGYLNTIFFGQSSYGVETAAQSYFGKSAAELDLPESALLAGVIRSPNFYSPYTNPDQAKRRRDLVIDLMLEQKKISAAEANAAKATPVQVVPIQANQGKYPYFVDYVKEQIMNDSKFGATNTERANTLYRGGLRIYTTINPGMQDIAEDVARNSLNQPDDPASSLVAIEPKTGYIKAMVGGDDYQNQKFNLAVQAKRQPGSAFKPFVLATAIENGIPVDKTYDSASGAFKVPGGIWKVGSHSMGNITLRKATAFSVNGVFARLILEIGAEKVVSIAHKLGITSQVNAFPAIALGGLNKGVSPLEMASAYSTFANNGLHAQPRAITKITDADGNILRENIPTAEAAIDPVTAYLVANVLTDVIQYGTARSAGIGRPAAGKTGTTEHYSDAWFVGFTPELATAVWVGYPQSRRQMTSVHGRTVFGGTFPAEIWQKFMVRALKNIPATNFEQPRNGIIYVNIDKESGLLATAYCPPENIIKVAVSKENRPKKYCNLHKAPPMAKIPNVIGMSVDEAQAALTGAGFTVEINSAPAGGVPSKQVISQSPAEESEAPQGSIVTITVSADPNPNVKLALPNLIGQTETQALATLSNLKLSGQIIYISVGESALNGKVILEQPLAGTQVSEGSTVILRVGKM